MFFFLCGLRVSFNTLCTWVASFCALYSLFIRKKREVLSSHTIALLYLDGHARVRKHAHTQSTLNMTSGIENVQLTWARCLPLLSMDKSLGHP